MIGAPIESHFASQAGFPPLICQRTSADLCKFHLGNNHCPNNSIEKKKVEEQEVQVKAPALEGGNLAWNTWSPGSSLFGSYRTKPSCSKSKNIQLRLRRWQSSGMLQQQ